MKTCSISAGQLHRSLKQATKRLVEPAEARVDDVVAVEMTAEEWTNILALLEERPSDHADDKSLKRNELKYLDSQRA